MRLLYFQIISWMTDLNNTYPDQVHLMDIGETYERRNMTVLKVRQNLSKSFFSVQSSQLQFYNDEIYLYIISTSNLTIVNFGNFNLAVSVLFRTILKRWHNSAFNKLISKCMLVGSIDIHVQSSGFITRSDTMIFHTALHWLKQSINQSVN